MKVIFIRHGEPDYYYCDQRGFIGQGRDLAPLSSKGLKQAEIVSHDTLLIGSDLIVSSPYTRALQTAAIISKNIGLDINIEIDLHELIVDKTFTCDHEESSRLYKEFNFYKGTYPPGSPKRWEPIADIISRINPVIKKYMNYNKIIIITHGGIIRRFVGKSEIGYCIPYEIEFDDSFKYFDWV